MAKNIWVIFILWTLFILIGYVISEASSAIQQSALAAMTLVNVILPYCIVRAISETQVIDTHIKVMEVFEGIKEGSDSSNRLLKNIEATFIKNAIKNVKNSHPNESKIDKINQLDLLMKNNFISSGLITENEYKIFKNSILLNLKEKLENELNS